MTTAPGFRDSLYSGGMCGALIAERDWSQTALGPIEGWSAPLRTATLILLRSPVPMVMLWGEGGVMLYNDAYAVFAGKRHPQLLGSPVREGWPEVADFNDNVMRVGLAGGTLRYQDQELTLYRNDVPEQVWMNLDYSPVIDEDGRPGGVLCVLAETTGHVTARAALVESEARFRLMVDTVPQIIWIADAEGRMEFLNRQFSDYTGAAFQSLSPAEIAGPSSIPATARMSSRRSRRPATAKACTGPSTVSARPRGNIAGSWTSLTPIATRAPARSSAGSDRRSTSMTARWPRTGCAS